MRFAFGVAGFVVVLVLLERYDEEHSSGLFWPYVVIVWLGYALANRDLLRTAVSSLHSVTAAPVLSSSETTGKNKTGAGSKTAPPTIFTSGAGGQAG